MCSNTDLTVEARMSDQEARKRVAKRIADAYNAAMTAKHNAGIVSWFKPATPDWILTEWSCWSMPFVIEELVRLEAESEEIMEEWRRDHESELSSVPQKEK